MAKILILIGAHLCTAPRPQKEAVALAAAGHDVTVCGVWFDPELAIRDRTLESQQAYRFESALDFRPNQPKLRCWGVRLQSRLAREAFSRWGLFTPALLGYGARALLRKTKQVNPDFTIVHSEAGLWVAQQLINDGYRVGVDFEDWFSQDLLPEARKKRPVSHIERLEKLLMEQCSFKVTTSYAMANAFREHYGVAAPQVIYNTFPRKDGVEPKADSPSKPLKLHWFSQTIGPGRGLETLFSALPMVNVPTEVHLRGNYPVSSQAWMEPLIPKDWRSRIFVHPIVSNAELPRSISEYDVGLALEMPYCKSRQHTITNKLFQYLQAGLATIASNTIGQQEVLSKIPDAGTLIPFDNPAALATAVNHYGENYDFLQQSKQVAYAAGQQIFCYENQVSTLLNTLDQAL